MKYVCCDCKRSFCSLCSELQETLHRCSTCQLLRGTAFQRPQLMRLRVKDLRQYLQLRNIATDTCREKADLVDLVLCHRGAASVDPGNQPGNDDPDDDPDDDLDDDLDDDPDDSDDPDDPDDPDTGGLQPRPLCAPPSNDALSVSAPQGEPISRSDSSGTSSQENGESASLLNLESTDITPEQATPLAQRRARASLSDLANADDIESLSVRQLKEILARNFVNYSGCCEKWELVERVNRLYRETEENRRSLENVSNDLTAVVAYPSPICNGGIQDGLKSQLTNQDETLCRICMDAVIDCVLLECGHMVTCTRCGKRMNECPICRQYVVRAVHVFRS